MTKQQPDIKPIHPESWLAHFGKPIQNRDNIELLQNAINYLDKNGE